MAATGRITLTPSQLRTSAGRYGTSADEIDAILGRLRREQNTIRSNWQGGAFDKFELQFNSLVPKVQDFARLLRDIDSQLRSVANIIERTDQDIARQINVLGSN